MVEIAGSIAGIVSTVLGVGKCFMYLFNHKRNLRNLKTEVEKLKVARDQVEGKVEAARNNVEKIEETVEQWVIKVHSIVPEAETLIKERANVRCFNLETRYKQSRKASKKVKDVAELLELQEAFGDQVSRPIIHEDPRLVSNKDYLDFQSRSSTLEDVLKALDEAEVDIIGVHGMGGIGKTTLVKEVGRQAKVGKRFDKVIFVEVTDKPNIKEIREEIANNLGLKFDDKETETARVNKLFARLKQEKTILIILDDIWVDLDMEKKLGIPFGENHKGCKLLLTARDRNVLDRICSKSISIDVLNEDEAWSLFRKMTGEVVDMRELQSLPNDVCKECGGLPIAIVTVARALKNKGQRYQWENALQELRRPSPIEFKGVLKEAYSKIALSYNYLEGEDVKKVFLLCSIMTYDASISNLFKFVMGLNILEGNKLTIEEARIRLNALLCKLKESCLLIDFSSKQFSMHDVVRDIAITISYKDHHVLTERNDGEDEWENVDILKKCTKIFLASSDIISKHWAEGLECPKLEFFYMDMHDSSFKFPEKFFSGMTKLKVLSLNFLPPSVSLPTGLRTLCLDGSEIGEVAILGELKKLKILSLRGCYKIKQLPTEISQLTQLRSLDLSKCENLLVITPYVISNLVRLEELYMRGCSVLRWAGGPNDKRSNASLEELLHLSCLTALEIDIKDEKILPKGFFSKKLERYRISVGDWSSSFGGRYLYDDSSMFSRSLMHIESSEFIQHKGSRTIKMKLNSSISLEELQGIKNVEFLCLDKLQNVKNGLQELDSDGFSQLKHLHVHNNPNLLSLVDPTNCVTAFPLLESLNLFNMINLEKICNGQPTTESFCKLKFIEVKDCHKLTILFSFSTAKSLPQLQRLRVEDCKNVKEIFAIEGEDNDRDQIEFFQLRFLTLKHLPRLASFCSGMTTTSTSPSPSRHNGAEASTPKFAFPRVTFLELDNLPAFTTFYLGRHTLEWPMLEELHVRNCKKVKTFASECCSSNENNTEPALFLIEKINPDLKELIVNSMIPLGILQRFNNLEKLKLDGASDEVLFSYKEDCKLDPVLLFQNLTHLTVTHCHGILMNLITPSVARSLLQLREMTISSCNMILEVVEDERDAAKDEIDFPKLKSLSLISLKNLVCFYSGDCILKLPSLEELEVNSCNNMKTFFQGALSAPKLQKIKERISGRDLCEGDLNSTIQQIYKLRQALTLIGKDKDIKQICRGKISDDVETLTIVKDKSTSIPVEILETFHNLEDLKLKASSYKELFSCGNDNKRAETFTHLKILEVLHCHNLTTLVPSPTSFENLTTLEVQHCNGLRSLLTSSTAKSLVRLQKMTIERCEMLTEVIANEEDIEKDVVFKKLESLSLDGLENLTSFCSGNYTFKFLSLKRLIVHNCPKMETFSGGVLSTPKLQKVEKDGYDLYGCWDYGLNTTIKQSQKMVVFPDRNSLELGSLKESAEKLWDIQLSMFSMSMSSSYRDITCLILVGFQKLKYVFPSSLVKDFEQLQQLEIRSCNVLREIVTMEEVETTSTFVFPRVTALKLECLPQLTSFYPEKHTSEWPVLRTLEVYNCEKVKTFTSELLSFHEDSEEAHSLLLVEKINPNLEALRLSEIDSVMTWQGPFSENFFCKLKRLVIIFNKSASVPVGILQRFKNLEMLKLCRIQSIELFFCGEDEKTIGMSTHIKGLELDECDELLEYLWEQDSNVVSTLQNLEVLEVHACSKLINVGPSSASFQNLKVLTVADCQDMVNLITSSAAKSLVQLTQMQIRSCYKLMKIVENEQDGSEDEIIFTKLKWLSLENLRSLACFCTGKYTFKFPTLEELIVKDCTNMKTFCEGVLSTPRLQKVWDWKDKCLNIGSCSEGDLNTIIQQLPRNVCSSDPKALTLIEKDIKQICRGEIPDEPKVDDVKALTINSDKSTNIPVEILETFHNVENLQLKASSYKVLFSCGNDDKRVRIFTHLKILEVFYCKNLITLLPSPTSFENLATLEVRYCNGLRSLLASSTAKSLVRLQKMTIEQCEMLTEVVANEEDIEKDIVFKKLKSLSLDCLENLTSFCSGNYTFKFLSLERLIVHNCPKMETFSGGVLSTPKLQKVDRDLYDFYGCWDYDLNTTMKQLQKMVVFRGLELGFAEKLWDIQLPMSTDSSYRNITHLILVGFLKLKYVFPSSLVKDFEQLRGLEISCCNILREIVTMEEVETTSTFVFPRVTALKLQHLPELTSFYPRKHTSEWPVLRTLEVINCEKVKTFTSEHLMSFHEDSEEAHSLLLVEKINPNLEALRVSEIDSVMTWQGPFSENFFCKLKRLEIIFNKSASVPVGILQRFKNLEMLKLHQIQSIELFFCGEDEKTIGMPTHIKGLELGDCYDLEYLWKQDSKVPFVLQNLEVLEVYWCSALINVGPSSASFQNLKVLTVSDCWDMVNLITSSAAKCLVQLTEMEIHRCNKLIEIVENDQDGAEYEIIFTKLKWLSLENLQSLTCFCTGKYTFKFPTLEELIVKNCTNMKTFCEGVLSTPRLQKVWEDKCLNIGSCSEGELNTIIQQLHKNVVDKRKSKQIFQLN